MLSTIVDHIKLHRHELGHHALFVGSGVVIPPRDQRVDEIIQSMALEWLGDRLNALPPERRGPEAIELFAREVTDHGERCLMLRERLKEARAAEGHIRLARLIKDGYFPTLFMAEPDRLLEQSLEVHHLEPEKDYHHFVAGMDDAETIAVGLRDSTRVVVVKCGGDLEAKFLPVSRREIRAVYDQIHGVIAEAFRVFSIFVAYTDRDESMLPHVSREGGKMFWVNRTIPIRNERLFDELKIDSPASVEYHSYQPEVMALLEARHSSRHLLCREAGTFNEFFGKTHTRLLRRSSRRNDGRRKDLTVLRGGPYRFLDYFDVKDEDFYFGREDDIDAVLELLRAHRLTVLFGKSGSGKTSLLRAGLTPALQHEAEQAETPAESWLAVTSRCSDDPAASIRSALLIAVEEAGFETDGLPAEAPLPEFLPAVGQLVGRRLAIFLDQFEEYFVHLGPRVQESFLAELTSCLKELENVHFLLAVREDFVGALFELQPQIPEIMHHLHRLHRFTREQAEDAILKPAQAFDIRVERQLVDRLLDDLYRDGIEPAQLEIVCDRLYEAKPRGMRTITTSVYDRLGGATRILSEFLTRILAQLSPGDRKLAKQVLKDLVASSEVSVARPLERIASDLHEDREEVEGVLARLVDLRLVRAVGKERYRQYELIHDYIAEEIKGWLSETEVQVQDVQDLLIRQLNNYEKFGILMHADELRIINEAREGLTLSLAELDLIMRSAAVEQMEAEYWFGRLNELGDQAGPLLEALLGHELPQVRLIAARAALKQHHQRYLPALVELLDDSNAQVQEAAETTLRARERDLITELARGRGESRALAARAVGRLRLRRGLRHLLEVMEDGDLQLRNEVTGALLELQEPRTADLLLRRLTGAEGLSWTGAYGLGHLGQEEEVLKALLTAREAYPELPKLHYALGLAYAQRRDFEEATAALQEAERLSRTEQGLETVRAMLEEVASQRQRAAASESAWPMFHRSADNCGATSTTLTPPLKQVWNLVTKEHIVGSPVVADGLVFVGSRDGNLYAVDAKRGQEQWHLRTGDRIESTPAIGEGRVFVGSHDGHIHAVATESGRRLWHTDLGSAVRSSCSLSEGRLFVGNRAGQVVALDPDSGVMLWQAQTGAEVSAVPAVVNGTVVVGSWDCHLYAFATETGERLWQRLTEAPVASSPAVSAGVVFCGSDDGHLYAVALESGQIYWRVPLGSQIRSSPAVGQGRVVVGTLEGKLCCLSAGDGDPLWSAQTAEEILGSPVIAGEVVYVGSKDGALYAFELQSGEHLWRHQTSYGVYSSPAVAENVLYVGLHYYDLVALAPED